MSAGHHHAKSEFGPLLLGLFGILCGAVIIVVFHYVARDWCRRRRAHMLNLARPPPPSLEVSRPSTSSSNLTRFLKVYLYSKEWKEGTCAVCLSEFIEGEEVRILPDCAHSFHVPCVDMWLYSHPSCPLCRSCTTPRETPVVVSLPSSGELPSHVESLPSSGELPSPAHNHLSDFGG